MKPAAPLDNVLGIVPSLNTPFTEAGELDLASLGRTIAYLDHAGCAGILALAVAGESASLARDEKLAVLEALRAHGGLPVIAGVSAASLGDSVELAAAARDAGAIAVLWQPPAGLAERALADGLSALGDAGPGAVVLQDLDWSGPGLEVAAIQRLAASVPALAGIKIETTLAGPKYSAVLEATGGRLHVSGGWAAMQMIEALRRGVHAFMPTGMEPLYVRVEVLFRQGRLDEARRTFEAFLPALAFANQHIDVSIRFLKHLRHIAGLFASERCRPPVRPLDAVQRAEAEHLARRALRLEQA